ncbi:MAG: tetraacyldisaccharide 4'-kinase [Planctomycetota bacterium]
MIFLKQLWFKAVQQNQKGVIYLLVRLFFKLLSLFYLILIKLRILLYQKGIIKSSKLPAYIISVGNITVGGTGKTPFVNYLSETLTKNSSEENSSEHPCTRNKSAFGGKVGILSRGYGSRRKQISDDESFPLPDNVVRIVTPNRIIGGTELIERHGIKTIILDDGFQHLKLKRDINLIIIDATNSFGNGWVLPGGILREPLSCLNRADIFVITHTDLVTREQLSALESKLSHYNKKIIRTIHKPQYLVLINPPDRMTSQTGQTPDKKVELSEIRGKTAWGFCGIGNPYQFHKTLEPLCNIKGFSIFSDHYYYSTNDLSIIFDKAKDKKSELFITTEKDALRLKDIKIRNEMPIYYLKIKIEVIGGEDIIQSIEHRT